MKPYLKTLTSIIILAFLLFSYTSCQDDSDEAVFDLNESSTETTATVSTEKPEVRNFFKKIIESSLADFYYHIVLDEHGIANMLISSEASLPLIKETIKKFNLEGKEIKIVYPFGDQLYKVITNSEQVDDLNLDFSKKYLSINFPMVFNATSIETNAVTKHTVNNNDELNNIIKNNSFVLDISYPLTLKKFDDELLTINNDEELEKALKDLFDELN